MIVRLAELSSAFWNALWYPSFAGTLLLALIVAVGWHRLQGSNSRRRRRRRLQQQQPCCCTIAFFHPHCSAGGGGERVLWKMVQVLGDMADREITFEQPQPVIIYTVDPPSKSYEQDLRKHVQDRFSLPISNKVKLSFVHLHEHAHLLEPARSFSLLVESIGSMRLAYKALRMSPMAPDIFIDTTGCAFTYVPATLCFGCRVLAYVHYPTISTDMLQLVWERRRTAYNHQAYIASSAVTTYVKLVYYLLFAVLYGAVGSLATLVLVNSTWTYHHVRSLWKWAAWRRRIRIVFPPCSLACDSSGTKSSCNNNEKRQPVVLSIGQFRPEKDHTLQIESLARLLQKHPSTQARLVLIGSCRGASDEARLQQLRELCAKLQVSERVDFVINQPFSVVQEWLQKASIGIHTMWNEHFGIGIVEMMAAGLIVIAHNSGGPQSDIVVPIIEGTTTTTSGTTNTTTGFLASTVEEYSDLIHQALCLDPQVAVAIRRNAQKSAKRFSDEVFAEAFEKAILELRVI